MTTWTDAHHQVAQEEATLAYWRGYADGWRDHGAGLEAWAEHFCASAEEATVRPIAERHADVIRHLVARMTAERGRSA